MTRRVAARVVSTLALLPIALICQTTDTEFNAQLGFEGQQTSGPPVGWKVIPAGSAVPDGKIVHTGGWSVRIERPIASPGTLSGITKSLPLQADGKTIEIRGFLRTKDVTGYAGLFLREEGESGTLEFDDMRRVELKGTNDWKKYSVPLPRNPRATTLVFGVLVTGTGTVWADDLELLTGGSSDPEPDHEFDEGSRISLDAITPIQLDNLVTLGKVWGFLKYHHRAVTSGQVNWDYSLFRVMPAILAAPDRAVANKELVKWIANLGPLPPCNPCAKLEAANLQLPPPLDWLQDEASLGKDLSLGLRTVYANRSTGPQYYVSLAPNGGNPEFLHEPSRVSGLGDTGFRILAIYRFWNIIEYWYPDRDVPGQNWDTVLRESIPAFALAKDLLSYRVATLAVLAKIEDTHANVPYAGQPPLGACGLPVTTRFIGNQAAVTGYSVPEAGKASGLKIGDVITELDGVPVSELMASRAPYYGASNEAALLRSMAITLTRGPCGDSTLVVHRDGADIRMSTSRVQAPRLNPLNMPVHDLTGPTFRLLSNDVAYVKLSSIRNDDLVQYIYDARDMLKPKLTKLELQILEALWQKGACSVREIQETFPEAGRPAYTTVQTVVYRLERKKALRCVKRISNANIFEAVISRNDAQRRFVDELLAVFGGRAKLVMAHLVESGELTLDDIKEAEKSLRQSLKEGKSK